MQSIVAHDGLTLEFSKVTSVFDTDGQPVWAGKVTLIFRDQVSQTVTKITANFSGETLVDFEGEPEDGDPVYEFCEMWAGRWAGEISAKLGKPSYADAA